MGDSLASNGRTAASHFCYLLSNCSFGTYEKKSSKLVLIGSSHNQDFSKFCQIGAIQATEIFEFAQSLLNSTTTTTTTSTFNSDNFLKYKLIYANKLVEHGLMHEAYKYIEIIANTINNNVSKHTDKLAAVYHLANRLKVYHPDYFNPEESESEWQQPLFLTQLNQHYSTLYSKNISHLITSPQEQRPECKIEAKCEQISFVDAPPVPLNHEPQSTEHIVHEPTAIQNVAYDPTTYQDYSTYSNYNQPTPLVTEAPPSRKSSIHSLGHQAYLPNEQAQQHHFNYQPYYPSSQPTVYNQSTTRSRASSSSTENNLVTPQTYDPNFYQAIFTPDAANIVEEPERVGEERVGEERVGEEREEEEMKGDGGAKADESKKASLWDWFKKPAGPKKMILPDDRKKTIVWDDKLKKYVNKENGSSAASSESVKPPPISVPSQASAPGPVSSQAIANSATNKFSLRNSNAKRPSSYYAKLDIMADKSKKSEAQVLAPVASNLPPPSQLPPRFFVPDTNNASMQPQQQQEPVPQQALYFNPAVDSQQ
ncbi:transport Sec16A isoform X1 [Brachionus plicatilis]|uniref:Transport Sec16A isoform X1 n=1 Tax=Brachionus plicatilis TaxID=10195 RepID=A0A3M7SWB6_BRAPC|nr:transport Sec16A isoform X1 [Brachionus plicatilis]